MAVVSSTSSKSKSSFPSCPFCRRSSFRTCGSNFSISSLLTPDSRFKTPMKSPLSIANSATLWIVVTELRSPKITVSQTSQSSAERTACKNSPPAFWSMSFSSDLYIWVRKSRAACEKTPTKAFCAIPRIPPFVVRGAIGSSMSSESVTLSTLMSSELSNPSRSSRDGSISIMTAFGCNVSISRWTCWLDFSDKCAVPMSVTLWPVFGFGMVTTVFSSSSSSAELLSAVEDDVSTNKQEDDVGVRTSCSIVGM
mmetsp:Transcript_15167/g.38207  ORF Transcript_15167/g.38207 Transcript_15167/m.38207 type:complete len:253 (+) Transcript_15167:339-1097(+)